MAYPNAENTGPAAGGYTSLLPVTGQAIDLSHLPSYCVLQGDGSYLISGCAISGSLDINLAATVKIIGCTLSVGTGGTTDGITWRQGNWTVQYCQISGTTNQPANRISDAIHDDSNGPGTVDHCNIFWCRQAVNSGGNSITITNNYLHDIIYYTGDHSENIYFSGGNQTGLTVTGNTIYNPLAQTACIFMDNPSPGTAYNGVTISGNFLGGGAYAIYGGTQNSGTVSNLVIENNIFTTYFYASVGYFGETTFMPAFGVNGNVFSGNTQVSYLVGSVMTYQQARFYSSDALATTLASSLGPTGNPSVQSIAGLPTSYPFTMLIDWGQTSQEAISVTSAPTGGGPWSLPCTRGIDNSTGGSGGTNHSSGAVIVHGITAQDYNAATAYTSGFSGLPWEFNIISPAYGATGNVQVVQDGAMTTGGSSTTLTCATTTPFTAADVGKAIIVNGAGASATTALPTTIAGFTSSSIVTLTAGCSTSVTGATVIWGTDDTTAIQNAINTAATWMESYGYARVYIPPPPNGVAYMIAGPLVTTGSANAQLTIPNPSQFAQQPTLHFYAEASGIVPIWNMTVPQLNGGFVSTGTFASQAAQSSNYGTYFDAAVLGGTPSSASLLPEIGGLVQFANIHVIVENLTVTTPASPLGVNYCGISLRGCAKGELRHCAALITTPYYSMNAPNAFPSKSTMAGGLSVGLIGPGNGNNACAKQIDCQISGYAFGQTLTELTFIDGCLLVGNGYSFKLYGSDPTPSAHGPFITNTSAQECYRLIQVSGAGEEGFFINADIDIEQVTAGAPGALISDTSSGAALATLYGYIRLYGDYSTSIFPPLYPINVKLISVPTVTPGWVFSYGGFSTAGSAVAVQNPYWHDATVAFSGGSIISVNAGVTIGGTGGSGTTAPAMTATGLTGSGQITWPSGAWLSFGYSGSPTWNVCVL